MKRIILRPSQVSDMLGISKPTLWRLEKDGQFVPKIALGPAMVGFLASDVEAWIRDRYTGDKSKITGSVARAMGMDDQGQTAGGTDQEG